MNCLTEHIPKVPAYRRIHRPERQGDDEKEVSHREVQPVFISHAPLLLLVAHNNNNQSIPDYSRQEDDGVDSRQEDPVEISVFMLEAGLSVVSVVTWADLIRAIIRKFDD